MADIRELVVFLGDDRVGTMRYAAEAVAFRFDEAYVHRIHRPVLGQMFEDDLTREHRVRSGVPAWFANLLPEGPLRELVAGQLGIHPSRDFFLLGHLGNDLPGAIRVSAEDAEALRDDDLSAQDESAAANEHSEFDVKFSLAGVQLKFSVLRAGRGATLPVSGEHGDFILKLPDERYEGVPENEFTMMSWAARSGIDIPEIALVDTADVIGLPKELPKLGKKAFLIRRFDRSPDGSVHIEDFAQVLNRYPTAAGKYGGANYETVARIIHRLGGSEDLEEFVRRLVAVVAMGNGDAHLKNWSLIYRDRRTARLAPAYDFVSTVLYANGEDGLALNLAKSKSFHDVTLESFRRMARRLELPSETALDDTVQDAVARLRAAWDALISESPVPPDLRALIDRRLRELPLLQL